MASRSIIQYNYFYYCGGADSETISIKSRENIVRYNVFDNNNGGNVVFRNGDFNTGFYLNYLFI